MSTTVAADGAVQHQAPSFREIAQTAATKAYAGGLAGGIAMGVNVTTLMWMRTTINFQYRNGMSTLAAMRFLYNDGGRGLGGIARFYRGLMPALFQGPLSRFGDTAANAGVLTLLDSMPSTRDLPVLMKTAAASFAAASFRIAIMPIDAIKTTLQVEGSKGLAVLTAKMGKHGPTVLWHGALGAASATFVGHYPWFFTYNSLNAVLPQVDKSTNLLGYLGRNALMGFISSAVSDTCSNSIRVLKTYRQTSEFPITYVEAAKQIVARDGLSGLAFRGLGTKILANGVQGVLFSVYWRLGQDYLSRKA